MCCYSAVNQGQLNQTIVDSVVAHLTEEKLPTVPRSIRHKYMSAFLLAISNFTKMDRVIPKVAGVEAPDLMFKKPFLNANNIQLYGEVSGIASGHFLKTENHPQARLLKNAGLFIAGIFGIGYALQKMRGKK